MLTLIHHVDEHIGAYWYSLTGELLDSEGNIVVVSEGTSKLAKINKTVKFYKDNGFLGVHIKHAVKQD